MLLNLSKITHGIADIVCQQHRINIKFNVLIWTKDSPGSQALEILGHWVQWQSPEAWY